MSRISDVAQLAKVSTATVSRVLANSGSVTVETRQRVLQAIEALNYHPNFAARNLRKLETKTMLVVVPDVTNMFFSQVLLGIKSVATEHGYQVLLGDTGNDPSRERAYLDSMREKRADGMILLTARLKPAVIEEFAQSYPVVLACEYIEGSRIPTVSIDNISAARKATSHLLDLGHTNIACILGPMNVVLNRDRLKGFMQSVSSHGIEVEPVLIQEGDYSLESGYNLASKLLSLEKPPTAIFAANDEMGIGCIMAVKSLGMRVPDDVAIVGFDDIKMATVVEPSLTTIAQPSFEIGVKSANMLLQIIRGEDLIRKQVVLPDRLVIRKSCGASEYSDM